MAVLTYNGNIIGKSSANDGVLTITQNNITKGTFSANSSSNKTVNIEVPTKLSDLTDDVVSGNYLKLSNNSVQTIENTDSSTNQALALKSGNISSIVAYIDKNDALLGYIGVDSTKKPIFFNTAWHDIALKDDVVAKSGDTMTGALTVGDNLSVRPPLAINNTNSGGTFTWAAFQNSGTTKGYLGVEYGNRVYPIFCESGQSIKEIALKDEVVKLSSSVVQKITNTTASTVIAFEQTVDVNGDTWVAFANNNGVRGYIGVDNNREPIFSNGQQKKGIALVGSAGLTGSASTNVDISKISVPALVLVANAGGNNNFEYALGMIVETSGTRYYSQIAGSLTVTCSNSTLTIPAGYNYYKILQ